MIQGSAASSDADTANSFDGQLKAREVVEFLDDFDMCRIPEAVLRQAELVVIDTVGCIVSGSRVTPADPILAVFADLSTRGRCDVLGTRLRTSSVDAAFVNSYLADVLDYEDTLISHPSAAVVPAAVALGQTKRSTGAEVIAAVIAGYEIGCRVGSALLPSPELGRETAAQFYWKSVAACVAAGKLIGLRGEQWLHAIGYACGAAPAARRGGFETRPLSWLKTNFAGQTQVGVLAALLAKEGFATYRAMLDGPRTLAGILGSDRWAPDDVTEGLGSEWRIADTTFKHYPCCLYLHPIAEAIEEAKAKPIWDTSAIKTINLEVPRLLVEEFADRRPMSIIDAEFSAPYVAALTALSYTPGHAWLQDEMLRDPCVLEMMDRVRLTEDAERTETFARHRMTTVGATITLADGQSIRTAPPTFRGSADRPLEPDELMEKFNQQLAAAGMGESNRRAASAAFASLRTLKDINEAIATLRPDELSAHPGGLSR